MKKVLLSISLLLTFVIAFGQPKVTRSSNANTVMDTRSGAIKNFLIPNYPDTLTANFTANIGLDSCGAVIFTYNTMSLWLRACSPKRWTQIGRNITIDTTNTVLLSGIGDGTTPLRADAIVSTQQGNALTATGEGLFVPNSITDGVTSGGEIIWVSGYTYQVSPVEYTIKGVQYSEPDMTEITLANSDVTYDRIDVVYADINGVVGVITGTAAEDPLQPSTDAATQLPLGFILVTANSTEPNVDQDWIYENYITNSWTTVSNTARIVVNSTNNPYSVPLDIEGTSATNGDNVRFTSIAPPTIANFDVLTFKIRSKALWAANSRIVIQFYSGALPVGLPVSLATNVYGFISQQIGTYQIISIPLTSFGALSSVTAVLFTVTTTSGRSIGFYIDDIQLQDGVISETGQFYQQGGNTFFSTAVLGTKDNFHQTFITNNTEKARLTTAGHLLVNQTADIAGYKLQVNGGVRINAGADDITLLGLATDNTATQVASKDASGNLVWRDVGSLLGSVVNIITDSSIAICSYVSNVASNCDTTIINNIGNIQTVTIMNDSTIIVCGPSLCDTLVVPQANFNPGISSNNGLTMSTPTNVQLGSSSAVTPSTLLHISYIDVVDYELNITGTGTSGRSVSISNSSNQALGVYGGGIGTVTTSPSLPLWVIGSNSTQNSVQQVVIIGRNSFSGGQNGIGGSIDFQTETSTSEDYSTKLISKWTDATNDTRTSQFILTGVNSAVPADLLTILGSGSTRLNKYGVGSFTAGTPAYSLVVDASGNIMEGGVGGGVYTASNGLTMTSNNTKIGGSLIENTLITTGAFTFSMTGTSTGVDAIISVVQSGTTQQGISATTQSGPAFKGFTSGGYAFEGAVNTAATTTVVDGIRLIRNTTGTAANGLGIGQVFFVEATDGTAYESGRINSTWTNATFGTRTGDLQFWTTNSATPAIKATLAGSGALRLHNYGVNTFTGVVAYNLGVDASGNVIEVAAAGGGMTNPMTTTGDIIYSSAGATPARLGIGTAGQVLTVVAGIPGWTTVAGTGSVTNVTWTGGIVSIANPTTTPAFTIAGTSGGIPYFSSGTTWASSAALAANAIVIGGGAGLAPSTTTTGTGVLTALGINVGSAGAFVTFNGALGTPSSGTATNLTGTATALNIGGNAATATILQTARTINGTSFDGSANITVTAAAGTLTGTILNATVVTSSLTSVGTITTGVWTGTAIAAINGGTGFTTYAAGELIYASAINTLSKLTATTNGFVLTLSGGLPVWAAAGSGTVTSIGMTVPSFLSVTPASITTSGTFAVSLSGTALPAANGGTGLTGYGSANRMLGMNAAATALEYKTISGTSNQITVTHAANSITLALAYNPAWQNLTDGATVTWNGNNGGNARLTLNGTGRTLVITNPVDGYTYLIRITQGSGGLKTITTWPTGVVWSNSVEPDLSDAAGAVDVVQLTYDATSALWIGNYLYNFQP